MLVDILRERDDGVLQAECRVRELGLGLELGGCLVFAVEGENEGGGGMGRVVGEGEEVSAKATGGGDGDGERGCKTVAGGGVWWLGIGAAR